MVIYGDSEKQRKERGEKKKINPSFFGDRTSLLNVKALCNAIKGYPANRRRKKKKKKKGKKVDPSIPTLETFDCT